MSEGKGCFIEGAAPMAALALKCRSLDSARDDGSAVTFGREVVVCAGNPHTHGLRRGLFSVAPAGLIAGIPSPVGSQPACELGWTLLYSRGSDLNDSDK